ncbi:MAG: hypothetical protein N2559_08510 [Anaerolineae bacterium]|nr:hypothetical protein [Anaerolineae bacterium]
MSFRGGKVIFRWDGDRLIVLVVTRVFAAEMRPTTRASAACAERSGEFAKRVLATKV